VFDTRRYRSETQKAENDLNESLSAFFMSCKMWLVSRSTLNLRRRLRHPQLCLRAQPASDAIALCPEERGVKRDGNLLSRWLTSPPEACFWLLPTISYFHAGVVQVLFDAWHGVVAVVDHGGDEGGIGLAVGEDLPEVFGLSGAAGGDDGDVHGL